MCVSVPHNLTLHQYGMCHSSNIVWSVILLLLTQIQMYQVTSYSLVFIQNCSIRTTERTKKKKKKETGCGSFPKLGYDFVLFICTCHAKTAEFFQSEYTRKPVKVLSVLVLEYNPLYSDRAIWTHTWSPGTRWSREPPDRDAGLGQLP